MARLLVLLALLGGCAGESDVMDRPRPADAGAGADAGEPPDAGPSIDAGMDADDAGPDVDAGVEPDAGLPADAGDDVDAGTDADAGPEVDGGVDLEEVTLTLAVEGAGSVRVLPLELECRDACEVTVPAGTTLQLVAVPDEDHGLAGWSGGACAGAQGTTATVTPRRDARNECQATFEARLCREFVTLTEKGRFELDGQPWAMKGTNYALSLGVHVTNASQPGITPAEYEYDYFLAPSGYAPEARDICIFSWSGGGQGDCCVDEASCRAFLEEEHLPRLKALGLNSVRLVGLGLDFDPLDGFRPVARCSRIADERSEQDYANGWRCNAPMDTPQKWQKLIDVMEEAINLLGRHGIRVVLLTGGHDHFHAGARETYLAWLEALATRLRDNPYLVAYDPLNEPPYSYLPTATDPLVLSQCDGDQLCKAAASEASRQWFQAITAKDDNHLVTVGAGTTRATDHWDPFLTWDHFTSWHIYPPAPWNHASVPGREMMRAEMYKASFGMCGVDCPYGGEYDGRLCRVASTPVGASAFVHEDGLYYEPLAGFSPRCPEGYDDGANCLVGSWKPGRDELVVETQAHFYLAAQQGTCPAGTSFDGANCFVGKAPVGAQSFVLTVNGQRSFYYAYPDGTAASCVAPAFSDGANCLFASIPSGWSEFVLTKTWYSFKPIECGLRRPTFLGEVGFSVYPNTRNLDPADYTTPHLQRKYQDCLDLAPAAQPDGDELEQVEFLMGGSSPQWRGLYAESRDCGIQGMHWWQFAGVGWGWCAQDHYGLYRNWLDDGSVTPPNGDRGALIARPIVEPFREMDFLAPRSTCVEPDGYLQPASRHPSPQVITGKVVDRNGQPVAYADIRSWSSDWVINAYAMTDARGEFVLRTPDCPPRILATKWGYDVHAKGRPSCSGGTANSGTFTIGPHPKRLNWKTQLRPPQGRRTACQVDGHWTRQ